MPGVPGTPEPGISLIGAPKELGQPDVAWGRGTHPTFALDVVSQGSRWWQLVGLLVGNQPTTIAATTGFVPALSLNIRPQYECYLLLTAHVLFSALAGNPGPSTSLSISFQVWVDGAHLLISPSVGGYGNDWTFTIPPIAANQTFSLPLTMMGILQGQQKITPAFTLLQLMYNVTSVPANWGVSTFTPRLFMVESIAPVTLNVNSQGISSPGRTSVSGIPIDVVGARYPETYPAYAPTVVIN